MTNHVPNHEFSYILHVLIDVKKVSKYQFSFIYPQWASLVVQVVKNPHAMQETQVRSLG